MKFIHAADIHLDSPLRGLERYEGAPVEAIRGGSRRAFENLVEFCLEERVDFLLIAGDLFDGDWKDYETGLWFVGQMHRLRSREIPVLMVRGNHDAKNRLTKSLRWPENVFEFPANKPATHLLESLEVAVHGQSFATTAVIDNLARNYPPPISGYFNIGLLHTALTGREGHEPYAPCSVEELSAKGYDYWALGHVHQREIIHRDPLIVFPGNLQGRHIRESGEKGCSLVTVTDGRVTEISHHAMDLIRWMEVSVDAGGAISEEDLLSRLQQALEEAVVRGEGRLCAIRLTITGETSIHSMLMGRGEEWISKARAEALDVGGGEVWLEKVILATQPLRETTLARDPNDPLLLLHDICREILADTEGVQELVAELEPFIGKLPGEVQGELALNNSLELERLLARGEQLALARLQGEGGS
ncbi:MAG: DNA repair exonuclease [Magnetococcales bacterium]|nr:DNA repair exonuclease [Magnetococcales bacterium]